MILNKVFKKTQTSIFLLITSVALCSVIIIFSVMWYSSGHVLKEYKERYYTEQTYRISYILRSNLTIPIISQHNRELFRRTAQEFATPIEFVSENSSLIYLKSELDHSKYKEPFIVDVPLVKDGRALGYVRAYYDLDQSISSPALTLYEKRIQNQQLMILGVGILVIIIIGFFISRSIANPIKSAAFSALKVLRGNREGFVPRKGTEEIKQLIDAINSLLIEFNNVENWRNQMMEDLTHELRTPITSVLTRLEAIIDGVYPTTTKNLQDIYDEVERLSRLVINVQKLSEAEGARFKLNIRKVNMVQLVKGVYEGLLFMANRKQITLTFVNPNKPCTAYVDPDRMIQIVTNIVSNAIKYTPNGGKVEIGLGNNKDEIMIYCRDNGVGINEEDLPLIFNRFYRIDKSRSRELGGSGIGLSITKALVNAHGGEIGVNSQPGEGSIFWVKIPIDKHLASSD